MDRRLRMVLLVAVVVRAGVALWTADLHRSAYWEYGELARNLLAGKGYSLVHDQAGTRTIWFQADAHPAPSAHMPPLYVLLLVPFLAIPDMMLRNLLLLIFQSLLGVVVAGAVYVYTHRFVSRDGALPAGILAAVIPEFAYAAGSATPTVVTQLGLLVLSMRLGDSLEDSPARRLLPAGVVAGALVLTRAELALAVVALGVLLLVRRGRLHAVVFLATAFLVYSPWVVRNAAALGEPVLLTTSGGLNLFRGHNPEGRTAWSDSVLDARLAALPLDESYEPAVDRAYRHRVMELVRLDPMGSVVRALRNGASLWLLDPVDSRSRHPAYWIPWALVLCLAGFGAVRFRGRWGRLQPMVVLLAAATVTAALFFVLPRYQTMVKVLLLPLAGFGVAEAWTAMKGRWHG